MEKLFGVDFGTGGCKAMVIDLDGNICASAFEEYPSQHLKPGWSEQDPAMWLDAFVKTVRSCGEQMKDGFGGVLALAVTASTHNAVLLDKDSRVIRPCIMWNDQRSGDQCRRLNENYGDDIFRIGMQMPTPTWTLPQLMWLKKHRHEIFSGAAMFLMPLDYLTFRLCGRAVTDATMAGGTMLYDLEERCFSKTLCERYGIPAEKLPEVLPTTSFAGYMNRASLELTGLSGSVGIAVGAQDQKIAAFGAGMKEGTVTVSLGTAGAMEILCANRSDVLPSFVFDDGESSQIVLEGCINTFGASVRWLRDRMFPGITYKEMDALAEEAEPGCGGVCFYPHLSGPGTPHHGRSPRSGWCGMTLATGRREMIRSVYEGLACEIRLNLSAAERAGGRADRLRLFGGGSRSGILCRIIAGMTGLPVMTAGNGETASFGAAKAAYIMHTGDRSGFTGDSGSERLYLPEENYDGIYERYISGQIY